MADQVDLVIDVRPLAQPPNSPEDFLRLWSEIESWLVGRRLDADRRHRVELTGAGHCELWLADPAQATPVADAHTRFAIRSIIEPAQVRHRCTTCERAGEQSYGPFLCEGCGTAEQPGRVCDRHAVILDGSLLATCAAHAPRCACGRAATFRCRGRRCAGRTAHCDQHRVRHPSNPNVSYCEPCYADQYPACSQQGCRGTGQIACEQVDESRFTSCGRRACARHAQRWQVFGPHRRGLGLCPQHAPTLRTMSRERFVFQLVAGTAARPGRQSLPRLSIVRHIFINARDEVLDMRTIDKLFAGLQRRLGGSRFEGTMRHLLERQQALRDEDVRQFELDGEAGRTHFNRLQQMLRSQGRAELAEAVTFADFRPRSNILFVRVPPEHAGRFIGAKHATINALSAALGVKIQVERR